MLWRVRTTVADEPGVLAELARACGDAGVNILGLQMFPGLVGVTDELVVRAPRNWSEDDVAELIASAGCTPDLVVPCSPIVLADQTLRHLKALHAVIDDPSALLREVAGLLEGSLGRSDTASEPIEIPVGVDTLTFYRSTPLALTEYARISAFAELAASLLQPQPARDRRDDEPLPTGEVVIRHATDGDAEAVVAMLDRCSSDTVFLRFDSLLTGLHPRMARGLMAEDALVAVSPDGSQIVALATITADPMPVVGIIVEDRWQRRAIGRRLLLAMAHRAKAHGAEQVLLRTRPENPAIMGLVQAAGFMGRLTHTGDRLEVRLGLRGLRPNPVPA